MLDTREAKLKRRRPMHGGEIYPLEARSLALLRVPENTHAGNGDYIARLAERNHSRKTRLGLDAEPPAPLSARTG